MDKVLCCAQLVKVLVEAYPYGAAEEDDDGYSPLACALRWEHSDAILKIILLSNRYENRGLYFVVRYGLVLGNFFRLMECALLSSKRRKRSPSVSYAPAGTGQDVGAEGGQSQEDTKPDTKSESKTCHNSPESDAAENQISGPTSPNNYAPSLRDTAHPPDNLQV